jgi:hypothetical protein
MSHNVSYILGKPQVADRSRGRNSNRLAGLEKLAEPKDVSARLQQM